MVQILEKSFQTRLHCSIVLSSTSYSALSEFYVRVRDLSVKCPLKWKSTSNPHTSTCTQQIVVLDVQTMGFAHGSLCQQHIEVVKTSSSVALPREHASQWSLPQNHLYWMSPASETISDMCINTFSYSQDHLVENLFVLLLLRCQTLPSCRCLVCAGIGWKLRGKYVCELWIKPPVF